MANSLIQSECGGVGDQGQNHTTNELGSFIFLCVCAYMYDVCECGCVTVEVWQSKNNLEC